ncbi:MAG: M15 family metallopeptidase [Azospirillaceae bacterium]
MASLAPPSPRTSRPEDPRSLADRAVPPPTTPPTADADVIAGGRPIPVDEDDPRAAEPLVDIAEAGLAGEAFYARGDGGNAPYHRRLDGAPDRILLRAGVVERLAGVDARLAEAGLALFLLDGWRPFAVQEALWAFFLDDARAAGAADEAAARAEALQYCGDPTRYDPGDPATWPAHQTGGAVDLTLARRAPNGRIEPLFMGGLFDDPSPVSHTAAFETQSPAGPLAGSASAAAARANRRILYWSMREAGFTNLATEWWHYDFGDRLWAAGLVARGQAETPPAAFYTPTAPAGDGR